MAVSSGPSVVAAPTPVESLREEDEGAAGEEDARAEAARLRGAIAEATERRDSLQQHNLKLQRKAAALLLKVQETSAGSTGAGGGAGGGEPGRRDDKRESSASENTKRYLECLRSAHDVRAQTAAAQAQYDKVALELQARLDDKEARVSEVQDAFLEFKREVARGAENLRTGKPIPRRTIAQFEAAELKKDQEVEKVRLKHINLRTHLRKLEQQLHAKEQLAEGLHLIDFEQLKIENQTLNEKIEERNEELHKLRKKTTSTVQVLTHLKEKLQFVLADSQALKRESAALEEALSANRDALARAKKERDTLRQRALKLRGKEGFAASARLTDDFAKREGDLEDLARRLAELQQRLAFLSRRSHAS